MEGGDARRNPHTHDRAIAYVVLKSDPDPQDFFSLNAWQEEYALSCKTKTYEFCCEILHFLSARNIISLILIKSPLKRRRKAIVSG